MKRNIFILTALVTLGFSCRKTPNFDQLSYEFTVSTSLDKAVNFTTYKTFFISDTVVYVGGVGADSIMVGPNAAQLTKAVKDNLGVLGYTLVARNQHPDVGLTLTAIKDVNIVVDQYPGWWDGYWPGCYWYYWCYGYYYPWSTVYSYTTGTVILNMYDLKNADANHQLKGIWNVTGLGALGSGSTTNIQLGVDAINQGFLQSPYLKTN